jgi:hypothetical protein
MKIHAKQLNQEIQDLLDGNSSNKHCYNNDDEYHNSDSGQDLDDYEILKKSEFYQSVASEQKCFLDSLTDEQRQEFKDVIMQAGQSELKLNWKCNKL